MVPRFAGPRKFPWLSNWMPVMTLFLIVPSCGFICSTISQTLFCEVTPLTVAGVVPVLNITALSVCVPPLGSMTWIEVVTALGTNCISYQFIVALVVFCSCQALTSVALPAWNMSGMPSPFTSAVRLFTLLSLASWVDQVIGVVTGWLPLTW